MLPEYVNPDNVNPHMKDPAAFGLDPRASIFQEAAE